MAPQKRLLEFIAPFIYGPQKLHVQYSNVYKCVKLATAKTYSNYLRGTATTKWPIANLVKAPDPRIE